MSTKEQQKRPSEIRDRYRAARNRTDNSNRKPLPEEPRIAFDDVRGTSGLNLLKAYLRSLNRR